VSEEGCSEIATFKPETFKMTQEEVIAANEKSKKTLQECEKLYGEDPETKRMREESQKVVLGEIKARIEKK
jgi:hypothetical protein